MQVGVITKQWSGLFREMFTNSDNFGISCMQNWQQSTQHNLKRFLLLVPIDLDVKVKATLIGAMFLIVSTSFFFIIY